MEFLHPAVWHDHDIDFARRLHPAMWRGYWGNEAAEYTVALAIGEVAVNIFFSFV